MLDHDPAARGPNPTSVDPAQALILDFLEWLAPGPRPYAEVMERWRTSCPRLTAWEDSVDRGYIVRRREAPSPAVVALTPLGRRALDEASRRMAAAA
jgi:hypothetical protein